MMTVKQLELACESNPYLLVRTESGHQIGINGKIAKVARRMKEYEDSQETVFISYHPCSFQEYLNYKNRFI